MCDCVAVVLGQNGWRVTYNPQNICTLKRSTVNLTCSYTYPRGHTVTETSWFYRWSVVKPQNDDRVEYYGDRVNDCTLRITDLRESDSAEYWFTFETQIIQGHVFQSVRSESYSGSPGVRLSVTGLKPTFQTIVTEGQPVTLTCSTTCTLTDNPNPTYIWNKNRQRLTNPKTKNNYLYLDPVSSEDTGRYSCAVNGHENLPSAEETLTVRYGPKRVSVSVSPSGELVEGSSVTLTCSSDANPPVDKYTWYKKNVTQPKASGQSYSITNISSEDSGEYYCEAENTIGAQISTPQLIMVAGKMCFYFKFQVTLSDNIHIILYALGKQASVKNASIGIIVVVLVLILCLSVLMWFRKKASKSTSDTRDRRDTVENGQGDSSPVYDNISGMAMTHTAAPTVDTDNQDNVHCASTQHRNQEVPEYSTAQPSQPQKQEEDVQYAAVKVNHTSTVDMPVETTVVQNTGNTRF
ncbi:B-cell receptor CD22-like [Salvelinus sp. IW2-2015]|uniref:B-cell receptor CD22-like n=1 Tax=Salvelinus sp. IW2-2015 TaxID=2691554 RepID=UPI000CDFEDA1|nr:B-cell receptor CD22-like [Salvelinus alpinus]